MGGGGTPGTAVGGTTHIHYDSHASNESKKVKRESPTGKRKQTVLRGAAGGGRDEDGPPPPGSHPPRGGCTTRGASTSNAAGWDPGRAHLASRNFLSRLGRSWLRRRRNQRSTWRTEQPLFLDSISTSAWGGTAGTSAPCCPPSPPPLRGPSSPVWAAWRWRRRTSPALRLGRLSAGRVPSHPAARPVGWPRTCRWTDGPPAP